MTAISSEVLRPLVSVHVVEARHGTLLVGITSSDAPKAKGGLLLLSAAALDALPAAIAKHLEERRAA
jgi:hypothetical protein